MAARVTSGPAQVVASGDVTTFAGYPLGLDLDLPSGLTYSIVFRFVSEPDEADVRVVPVAQPMRLELTSVNFDRADGRGSAVPVPLGVTDGVAYFMHFRVSRYGRTDDRTVHYTIYALAESLVPPELGGT